MRSTLAGAFSQRTSHTALPSPPMMECSSTVTTLPVFVADAATNSASIGLMVWMLIISASMPSAANIFSAANVSLTSSPVAKMVTSFPSFKTIPFPISNL